MNMKLMLLVVLGAMTPSVSDSGDSCHSLGPWNQLVSLQGENLRPFTILEIIALSLFSSPQNEPPDGHVRQPSGEELDEMKLYLHLECDRII